MSLFKSKEEKAEIKAEKLQNKAAKKAQMEKEKQEFEEKHGEKVAYIGGKYIGGNLPFKADNNIDITCYKNDIIIHDALALWVHDKDLVIPYAKIDPFTIKTEEQIQKDVTLTRLLVAGIFAFGLKKKKVNKSQYLILSGTDETNSEIKGIFEISKLAFTGINSANDARKNFLINHPEKTENKMTTPGNDPIEQIKKLAELKDMGILTEEEFNKKKIELLEKM